MKIWWNLLLVCPAFGACIAAEDAVPSTTWSADIATKFVRRGMVQVDNDVLQTIVDTSIPVRGEGVVSANFFGNMDLHDDTGDAWFPDGSAGRFSEIDLTGSYSRAIDRFDVTAGLTSYNLPRGNLFPNGERGSTNELFASISTDLSGFRPEIVMHYDYDEVDGWYVNGGVLRAFPINEKFSADVAVSLGWSDEDQSFWNYGVPNGFSGAGFADLQGTGRLFYEYDEHTTFQLLLAASTMIDDGIKDWFDVIGIDSNQFWVALGASWSF